MSFYKIRPRSGTKAQWETANTILAEREIGYELPDGGVGTGVVKMKMGDGVTAWNDLPYAIPIYLSPDDIVQDATTDSSVKVPSASVTKNLQDQVTALNNSLTSVTETLETGITIARYGKVRTMRVVKSDNASSTLITLLEKDKPIIEYIVPIFQGESASNLVVGYAVISTNGTISLKSLNGGSISSSIIRFSCSYISV